MTRNPQLHAGARPATYLNAKGQSTLELARRQFIGRSGHRAIGPWAIGDLCLAIGASGYLQILDFGLSTLALRFSSLDCRISSFDFRISIWRLGLRTSDSCRFISSPKPADSRSGEVCHAGVGSSPLPDLAPLGFAFSPHSSLVTEFQHSAHALPDS